MEFEYKIEREYIDYLIKKCNKVLRSKQELEQKLYYYGRSSYADNIQKELNRLDYSSCNKYNEMKHRIK